MENKLERGEVYLFETGFAFIYRDHRIVLQIIDDKIFESDFQRRSEIDRADLDIATPVFRQGFRYLGYNFILDRGDEDERQKNKEGEKQYKQ